MRKCVKLNIKKINKKRCGMTLYLSSFTTLSGNPSFFYFIIVILIYIFFNISSFSSSLIPTTSGKNKLSFGDTEFLKLPFSISQSKLNSNSSTFSGVSSVSSEDDDTYIISNAWRQTYKCNAC